jgi:hypothetical protein
VAVNPPAASQGRGRTASGDLPALPTGWSDATGGGLVDVQEVFHAGLYRGSGGGTFPPRGVTRGSQKETLKETQKLPS